jgi:hypothetical protein
MTRYTIDPHGCTIKWHESPNGEWVRYEDVAAFVAWAQRPVTLTVTANGPVIDSWPVIATNGAK